MDEKLILFLITIWIPRVKSAVPGTFFWRPRLAVDLAIPTTETTLKVNLPNKENIAEGLVTLIEGYQVGITVVALFAGLSSAKPYPHLNPLSAFFYTNVYRWFLRYISLVPIWLSGGGMSFTETHRVWKRRFSYMDELVPEWMRYMFPYVKKEEWLIEERDFRRFKKYSEAGFGTGFRYPNKYFNNFKSEEFEFDSEDRLQSSVSV